MSKMEGKTNFLRRLQAAPMGGDALRLGR